MLEVKGAKIMKLKTQCHKSFAAQLILYHVCFRNVYAEVIEAGTFAA